MKYIINYSNDTAFNIALEEYAFKHLLDEGSNLPSLD